jgi:SAM-dependent methyltransferase
MKNLWDERYNRDEYLYGTEPKDYFKRILEPLLPGRILLPAEGEGRNAVFAALMGWDVDAFDSSRVARMKALELARMNEVKINFEVSDVEGFSYQENSYDVVGLFFVHIHEMLREEFFRNITRCLKPGGRLLMEVFAKEQLERDTGGPKSTELLYSTEDLSKNLSGMELEHFEKTEVELSEGLLHQGKAVVIRVSAIKK